MDSEMTDENCFLEEAKHLGKDYIFPSDYIEEDSDAKMTLTVTSDEDSKDSVKNKSFSEKNNLRRSKEKSMEKISEYDEISAGSSGITSNRKSSRGSIGRKISTDSKSTKRKFSQVDWSSDEDEFLGFNEDGEAISEIQFKKIKENTEKVISLEVEAKKDIPKEVKVEKDISTEVKIKKEIVDEEKSLKEAPLPNKERDEVKEDVKIPLDEVQSSENEVPKQQVEVDKQQNTPLHKGKHQKDQNFRKPFDMGWKREFVYRATPTANKEKGEVYYISPSGKKLRTRTEVQQYLTAGLSLDNFTFAKEPLGFEEEVIRSAKPTVRSAPSTPVETQREQPLGKRVPKPKAPKGASPPPQGWTATKAVKLSSSAQSPRVVASSRPPDDNDSKVSVKSKSSGKPSKKGEPCTIQCALAMGMIPQLQCIKCLCLFHHECVGLDRTEHERNNIGEKGTAEFPSRTPSGLGRYICELCQKEPNIAQIAPIKSVTQSPPKIQPVASVSSQNSVNPGNSQASRKVSDSIPVRDQKQALAPNVGTTSVTNTILQNNKNDAKNEKSASLPQSIAVIKGRKYVVIRKPSAPYYKRSEEDAHNRDHGNENSTIDSSSAPSLQTGDDLPIRKRITNTRNKFSADSPVPLPQHQIQSRSTAESFAANFFSNVSLGYDILFQIFQYLKVQELLRAACVCRVWYVIANHRSLWKTVRMKNSQVNDWTGLAAALRRNETKHLDLRKMLISSTNAEEMWASFSKNIQIVVSLETIDLCRCSSKIVESLFMSNPSLKVLNAVAIKDNTLNLENLHRLDNLNELRLKSIDGCTLEGDLLSIESLKKLRHLSLTSFRQLGLKEVEVIGQLENLESLELGECSEFGAKFSTNVLPKLVNLERLRLETGQDNCCTLEILEAISKLEKLVQLELVNFDIKTGFDEKLAQCKNIKRLLLIPTYISQSATTNNIVLGAVLQLTETLQTLTWAVTLELLRVTALYVDQCDNKKKDKKFFDESIPVLKPVPGISDESDQTQKATSDVPQVEILPLVKVEKILRMGMPTTRFKILKVPYHATWRQNLGDMQ